MFLPFYPQKVLVAADSMKGSLSSAQVADAVEQGVHAVYPQCQVVKVPIGDGGEGTLQALQACGGARRFDLRVAGPLVGTYVDAYYICVGQVAVIELAQAAGLTLLANCQKDPLKTTTLGVGQLINDAIRRGFRDILLCVGGSATNDAAMGIAHALGLRFLDHNNNVLPPVGASMAQVRSIDVSGSVANGVSFTVACDVDTPFCGLHGAAYVFAPQKGATPQQVRQLDSGLLNMAALFRSTLGIDIAAMPGAGAAGGVAGAMAALFGAQLQSGAQQVLNIIDFDAKLDGCSLVLTGEGKIDAQTLAGKAPMAVWQAANRREIPVIAIGGQVDPHALAQLPFDATVPIAPAPDSPQQLARLMQPAVAAQNIAAAVARILVRP